MLVIHQNACCVAGQNAHCFAAILHLHVVKMLVMSLHHHIIKMLVVAAKAKMQGKSAMPKRKSNAKAKAEVQHEVKEAT